MRAYTFAELEALAAELPARYRPLPGFVAATGLRPEEWAPLERRDVDRHARRPQRAAHALVGRGRRPRQDLALAAAGAALPQGVGRTRRVARRLDTPLLFPAPSGGVVNLDNLRRREWAPAVEASGVAIPARLYDLRSTFASNALAAGVDVFELARVMGTSIDMIERHYGSLLQGAAAGIASRLAMFEAAQDDAAERDG